MLFSVRTWKISLGRLVMRARRTGDQASFKISKTVSEKRNEITRTDLDKSLPASSAEAFSQLGKEDSH